MREGLQWVVVQMPMVTVADRSKPLLCLQQAPKTVKIDVPAPQYSHACNKVALVVCFVPKSSYARMYYIVCVQ